MPFNFICYQTEQSVHSFFEHDCRSQRKMSQAEQNKSAITDHVVDHNHVIGWDQATIKSKESNRFKRHVRESVWIRRQGDKTMNRDGGNHFLPTIYDQLLVSSKLAVSTKSSNLATSTKSSNLTTSVNRKKLGCQSEEGLRSNLKL